MQILGPTSFCSIAVPVFLLVSIISTSPSRAHEHEVLRGRKLHEYPNPLIPNTFRQDGSIPFETLTLEALLDKANENPLSTHDKLRIIFAARRILADLNPHRFLQLNIYGVDIVSDLSNYAESLVNGTVSKNQTNYEFHADMIHFFQTLNDRHTVYVVPPPLSTFVARLPFSVREIFPNHKSNGTGNKVPAYVAHGVIPFLFANPTFTNGSTILDWDDISIDQVVRVNGRNGYGSNRAAQIANAVEQLTCRPLFRDPLPVRAIVKIRFQTSGTIDTVQVPWFFLNMSAPVSSAQTTASTKTAAPVDTFQPSESRQILQSRHARASELSTAIHTSRTRRMEIPVDDDFASFFSASVVNTPAGPVGHLKIMDFQRTDIGPTVVQLTRILKRMPDRGLVVDLRGNLGGQPALVKAVVELLSNQSVPQVPVSIRATELVEQFCEAMERNETISEMLQNNPTGILPAVRTARRSGLQVTGPILDIFKFIPINSSDVTQQRAYFGPFVTLIDGRTYSAGDLFAALQVDLNISLVVGTSDYTGAGGAGVSTHSLLSENSPELFPPLPGDVDFTTAFLPYFRIGKNSGAVMEFFGVKPDFRYYPTLNDAINDDCDLFEYLGEHFKK